MASSRTFMRLALAALTLAAPRLHAQPSTAGTPVAVTHLAAESNPTVIPDGTGGAFVGFKIAWRSASLPAEIAVARLLASSGRHPEWTALPPPPAGSMLMTQFAPSRILPAPQGQVLAFADLTSTSQPQTVFVRQMDAAGVDSDYDEFTPNYSFSVYTVLSRSDGGASIVSKVPGSLNLLETIVSPTGQAAEHFHPIPLNNSQLFTVGGERLVAVPSGGDGLIAIMQVMNQDGVTATGPDLLAVRFGAASQEVWSPVHSVVSGSAKEQVEPVAVSDDADGVIVAWRDSRSVTVGPDIYAVRLTSAGALAPGWIGHGRIISAVARSQYAPTIERDGAGGAWIAWVDERDTLSGPDVYFTRVLAGGTIAPGFAANGRVLCNATGSQTGVQITRDGNGGLFAVWLDARDGETDLYAQHLDANGNPTSGWAAGGNPVCTEGTEQGQAAVSWVANGRAITAWKDPRTGTDIVYAATLDAALGVLDAPRLAPGRLALAARVNPARDGVDLRLDAAEAGDVTVTLYDVSGRVRSVRTLVGPTRAAEVRFDAVPPGLYFANAAQKGGHARTKVVVLR